MYQQMPFYSQLQTLRMDGKSQKEDQRQKGQAIRNEHDGLMQSVLTKEQFIKWKSHEKERQHRQMEQRKKRKALKENPDTGSDKE